MKVCAIDIITGSVRSRTRAPRYALIMREDDTIQIEDSISKTRLFRMIAREKPDILAVDSLQEITTATDDIYAFLESLPPDTKLVVVTGGEKKTGLTEIARQYNITFNRFDPFAEARVIAEVAMLGHGVEVIAFEKETEIVITRNRSPGKGGWSQNRYARKIHGHVMVKSREIEESLKKNGLSFKKTEKKAFGGVSRVVLRVNAPRTDIPVHTHRGGDVQVRISGKRLDRIQYRELSARLQYLIVGIDPGTTIGIAALDLEGNLVFFTSSRQMAMSDVIVTLYEHGKPIIIASDVTPMPYTVDKIRRAFSAVPYTPRQDISVESKFEIAGRYEYANDHERDAISAATEAWRYWQHKWAPVLKRAPAGLNVNDIRAGLVKGLSLEQITAQYRKKPVPEETPAPLYSQDSTDERIRVLEGTIKQLRTHIADQEQEIAGFAERNAELEKQIQERDTVLYHQYRQDSEIKKRDIIIQNLRRKLKQEEKNNKKLYKRLKKIQEIKKQEPTEETCRVKIIPSLSREDLRSYAESYGIGSDDILFIRSSKTWGRGIVQELALYDIKGIIIGDKEIDLLDGTLVDLFLEHDIFMASIRLLRQSGQESGYVDRPALQDAILAWERRKDTYEKKKHADMLDSLFVEYQAEREREIRRHG
ncbi:MAG: DUF460 domain-containing protein [Methanospirillaceae archaeon]|nr:DUF460 domain-containing protein [Methanospirillaceae archaeon]